MQREKEKFSNNPRHDIVELCNISEKFDLSQVKWYLISGIRNIEYELPHELPNSLELRFQDIGKYQKNVKIRQ